MIRLQNLVKFYTIKNEKKFIANRLNLDFEPFKATAILGRNGAGKSTLLRIIAGIEASDSGTVNREGSVSWPVGHSGSFHPDLSGAQNVRFIARIYGKDSDELIDYVRDLSELGIHFYASYRTYSSGMKARLGFSLSMGLDFDFYLIDEVTAVGDAKFREKSSETLRCKLNHSAAIIVSHSLGLVKEMCDAAVVLVEGHARKFDDVDEAIAVHKSAMSGELPRWVLSND